MFGISEQYKDLVLNQLSPLLSLGSETLTFKIMITGFCLVISTSIDRLKIETELVATFKIHKFLMMLLIIWAWWNFLRKEELLLGATCSLFLCWSSLTGFSPQLIGPMIFQTQWYLLWLDQLQTMFHAKFLLVQKSPSQISSALKIIG